MEKIIGFIFVFGFLSTIFLCTFGEDITDLFLFFLPNRVKIKGSIIKTFSIKETIVIPLKEPENKKRFFESYTHFLIVKNERDKMEYEIMIPNDLYRKIKKEIKSKKDSFLETVCRQGKNYNLVAIRCKVK